MKFVKFLMYLQIIFLNLFQSFLSSYPNTILENNVKTRKEKLNKNNKSSKSLKLKNLINIFVNLKKSKRENIKNYFLLNSKEFKKIFLTTKSNTKNLQNSVPFKIILDSIIKLFPINKSKNTADENVKRLRKLPTEKVADFFVNLKINSTSEYWYYYYILSNVSLKGKINRDGSVNHWDFPNIDQIDKDNKFDEFYTKLKNKNFENEILKKFSTCRKKTMIDIRNFTITEIPKFTLELKADQYYREIPNPKKLKFSDFKINRDFSYLYQELEFYKQINKMPKAIIHHIHLTASFYSFSRALGKIFGEMNSTSNQYNEFALISLHEEDKVKPNEFSSVANQKIFFLEDIKKLINLNDENLEKLFKDNFILPDGRCIVTTEKTKSIPISVELKAFYYWRFCQKITFIFSRRYQEILQILQEKNYFPRNRLPSKFFNFKRLNSILQTIANILENINEKQIPQSYLNLMSSKEDLLSNTIWYKFESIFGLYESLFDNPSVLADLTDILGNVLHNQNVYGVEFRQKYDKSKGKNSKYLALVNSLKKYNLLISFILSGRKSIMNNGVTQQLNDITNINEENVTGFDFVGYEDDPFSGARNFFSLYMLKNQGEKNNTTNHFELMFNTLKKGKKLYLHAGETLYFPNYPIDEAFMDKFYINDNLIHSALLPNVERVGHGFAVGNNGLLTTIFKKKNIGLEICPISNQLLLYNNIKDNPGFKLLKYGLKVSISPDDPGFFGYMGVTMDWFQVIMNRENITPTEIYILLKNSILKSSDNIRKDKNVLIKRLQQDFEIFLNELQCSYNEADEKLIELTKLEINARKEFIINSKDLLIQRILTNLKVDIKKEILVNIYDEKEIIVNISGIKNKFVKKKN